MPRRWFAFSVQRTIPRTFKERPGLSRVLESPSVARGTAAFSVRLDIRSGHPAKCSTELRNNGDSTPHGQNLLHRKTVVLHRDRFDKVACGRGQSCSNCARSPCAFAIKISALKNVSHRLNVMLSPGAATCRRCIRTATCQIRVLAEARSWAKALRAGTSLTDLAKTTGHSEPYLRTRLPLAFLAPGLQQMIIEGWQPPDLSVARFVREHIPLSWAEQERQFGRRPIASAV